MIDADDTVAEDTIMLPAGVYLIDLVGDFDNSETGDLDISTDMIFLGAPSTIDGQMISRIMEIRSDANVKLQDLTLRNANYEFGGGALVINGGSLTLDAVIFDSNTAGSLGGAIWAQSGAVVDVDGCQFTNNNGGSGTAINIDGDLNVRDTLFRGNKGTELGARGAVAYVSGGNGGTNDTLFENVNFDQNSSVGSGGAILFLGRKLRIDGLVATANQSSTGHGGVLTVTDTAHAKQVEIVNATFNGNAADDGGAISFGGTNDTLDIRHSSFVSNTGTGWGGALNITAGEAVVTNSTFSGNQTTGIGGAIQLFGNSSNLTLHHNTFSGNSASGSGDALYLRAVANLGNNLIDGECFIFDVDEVTSFGGNVEGNGDSCDLDAGSDLVNQSSAQLGLQPLRNNVGQTPTHELTSGSVARGQGVQSICELVSVDQLYMSRGSECNSGAVESNTIFKDGFESG